MAVRALVLALLAAAAIAAGGCGGGTGQTATPTTTAAAAPSRAQKCNGARLAAVRARKLARLRRDVARLRRLAAPIRKHTFDGTPALAHAVDTFLVHAGDRDVPVKQRSRMFDLAAAAVSGACEQCFQALEANRPVGGGAKLACD
jgi:hypothetical protein